MSVAVQTAGLPWRSLAHKVAGCKKGAGDLMGEVGEEKFSKGASAEIGAAGRLDAASISASLQHVVAQCKSHKLVASDVVGCVSEAGLRATGGGGVAVRTGVENTMGLCERGFLAKVHLQASILREVVPIPRFSKKGTRSIKRGRTAQQVRWIAYKLNLRYER